MKKVFSATAVVFLIISGFCVLGANVKTNNITLMDSLHDGNLVFTLYFPSIDEIKIINKNDYQRIEIDSFSFLMDIGKPLLPVKNVLFALPPSAKVSSVDFQFDKLTQLPGFYNIEPAPIIVPIDETKNLFERIQEEWEENNLVTYSSDQVFPSENGEITSNGTLRKYSYVSLSVCPFQYTPLSGILRYYNSVKITITYDLSEINDALKSDTLADEKASTLFYNYNQIKNLYDPINTRPSALDEYDYLIITSEDLVDTVQSSEFLS